MTYKATLWRCVHNIGEGNAGEGGCSGFKYLEPGIDPERCGRVTLLTAGGTMREKRCLGRMIEVGVFELSGEDMKNDKS